MWLLTLMHQRPATHCPVSQPLYCRSLLQYSPSSLPYRHSLLVHNSWFQKLPQHHKSMTQSSMSAKYQIVKVYIKQNLMLVAENTVNLKHSCIQNQVTQKQPVTDTIFLTHSYTVKYDLCSQPSGFPTPPMQHKNQFPSWLNENEVSKVQIHSPNIVILETIFFIITIVLLLRLNTL